MQASQIGYAASSGPVERYFPLARRQSCRWLEFSCQNPVNFPQTFDRARIRRVRSLMERSGIRCGLHSASFVNTAEIMPTVRKAALAHLREYVDLTVALGCEYLVVHCGFHFSAYLDTVRAALYETMGRAVAYGERRRVPLVIENMNPLPGDSEFQYLGVQVEEFQAALRPDPLALSRARPRRRPLRAGARRHRVVRARASASASTPPSSRTTGGGSTST